MTSGDLLKQAIEVLAGGADRWGSDDCGCDDCAKLRIAARAKLAILIARARTKLLV